MTALIELYANNAYSQLAGNITDSQTTITVTSGTASRFPSPASGTQFFRLTVTGQNSPNVSIEIMYVTAVSGSTFTVIRGQEGTTAQAWSLGDLVGLEPTAGMMNQFVQPSIGVDTGAVNAYVVSTPQHESAYYMGMPCTFWTLNANTNTTPTLNLNGLGAKTIKNANGAALIAGQLPANTPISLVYDSSDASWRLVSPFGVPTGLAGNRAVVTNGDGSLGWSSTTAAQLSRLATLAGSKAMVTNSDGTIGWSSTTASQIALLNNITRAFEQSYVTTPYPGISTTILPNGLFIQTGVVDISGGSATVTFPQPFPNACLSVMVCEGACNDLTWGVGHPTVHGVSNITTASYKGWAEIWNGSNWSGTGPITQLYQAIGY